MISGDDIEAFQDMSNPYTPNMWHPWTGGENPAPGQMVRIHLKNSPSTYTTEWVPSEHLSWGHMPMDYEDYDLNIVSFIIQGRLH